MLLNREAYQHEPDNLIYDRSHEPDASNVTVTLSDEKAGILRRGQVLDLAEDAYAVHAADGKPGAIVAQHTEYAADDKELTVTVYISGTFRRSACISAVELSAADVEELRCRGIYLK